MRSSVSNRSVLTTKWVGNSLERACQSEDMIIHCSKKCGITTNVDGSEDRLKFGDYKIM